MALNNHLTAEEEFFDNTLARLEKAESIMSNEIDDEETSLSLNAQLVETLNNYWGSIFAQTVTDAEYNVLRPKRPQNTYLSITSGDNLVEVAESISAQVIDSLMRTWFFSTSFETTVAHLSTFPLPRYHHRVLFAHPMDLANHDTYANILTIKTPDMRLVQAAGVRPSCVFVCDIILACVTPTPVLIHIVNCRTTPGGRIITDWTLDDTDIVVPWGVFVQIQSPASNILDTMIS